MVETKDQITFCGHDGTIHTGDIIPRDQKPNPFLLAQKWNWLRSAMKEHCSPNGDGIRFSFETKKKANQARAAVVNMSSRKKGSKPQNKKRRHYTSNRLPSPLIATTTVVPVKAEGDSYYLYIWVVNRQEKDGS